MPVRGVFLVIGSVAIVGILGAVFVRQAATRTDDLSSVMHAKASSVSDASTTPRGIVPMVASPSGAVPVADDVFGANRMAQSAPIQVTPPVALPGGPVALPGAPAAGSVPMTTPALPTATPVPITPPEAAAPAPAAAPAQPATPAAAAAPAVPAGPAVDETALRYFAQQGDARRLNAEIARLRALYPNWYPPTDMTAPVPVTDTLLDGMWKLYSQGQYAAARAAIADRQANEPDWKVPADLLARLDIGEKRERLINASNAKLWDTVVQIAADTPSLLTCADVDVLWRLAEAFARSDRADRARDVDLYVLTNCQDPKERLATIQKAMSYLGDAELSELLALERTGADGRGEFAAVKGDIARRRVGAAAKDPNKIAPPEDIQLLQQLATAGTKADDAVLLGVYLFAHNDPEGAVTWFQLAKTRADTAEIARGLAYALNAVDRPAEAEAAAYRWRDAGAENKEVYLVVATALLAIDPPAKIEPEVMARMAKAISEAKYAPGAQDLGWYAYNTGQTLSAARWFSAALTWKPDTEPAAFGLALAAQKLGNKVALAQILRVWGPRSQRIADLGDPTKQRAGLRPADTFVLPPSIATPGVVPPARSGVLAPETSSRIATDYAVPTPEGTFVQAEATVPAAAPVRSTRTAASSGGGGGGGCRSGVRTEQLRGMSALNRGWCLLSLNRPVEASDAFDAAMTTSNGKARQDAAYGKTLANLRSGLTDAAAVSASAAPQDPKRATELRTEILTQRALASYADNRWVETLLYLDERSQIAPEQNDLLLIRAWSYYHLGRLQESKRLFVAVAGTGSREAAKALATLASSRQGMTLDDGRSRR